MAKEANPKSTQQSLEWLGGRLVLLRGEIWKLSTSVESKNTDGQAELHQIRLCLLKGRTHCINFSCVVMIKVKEMQDSYLLRNGLRKFSMFSAFLTGFSLSDSSYERKSTPSSLFMLLSPVSLRQTDS